MVLEYHGSMVPCYPGIAIRGTEHYHGMVHARVRTTMLEEDMCPRAGTCVRVPPRRRLPDPGVLQGTVTPRRRAQGGDAGSGSYLSLHARRHYSDDSRGRPRR